MTIAFIHNESSFLPELRAYHEFFSARNVRCETFHEQQWKHNKKNFDVEWHMMGTDRRQKTCAISIHEYASASTPPFMAVKNRIKRLINTKPDYRLFLNNYVSSCFHFTDGVPYGYRDMGIDDIPVANITMPSTTDFIYTGSIDQHRNIEHLLRKFATGEWQQRTLLILSKDYGSLQRKFAAHTNIRFEGPVPQASVRSYLQQARYAVNYIPDREPFNRQTSTKLLEYIQQRLPIVTTDYPWIRSFEKEHGGRYFYLDSSLENFKWDDVRTFRYEHPDITSMTWEAQILKSGIWDFLQSKSLV